MFLVKWKSSDGSPLLDVVLSQEANEKMPQHVIKFYEEKIHWNHMVVSDAEDSESGEDSPTAKAA